MCPVLSLINGQKESARRSNDQIQSRLLDFKKDGRNKDDL